MSKRGFGVPLVFLLLTLLLVACGDATSTSAPAVTTAAASSATTAASVANPGGGTGTNAQTTPAPQVVERKIIRNATITIQVDDMEIVLGQLRALAVNNGGYIFQENTTLQGERPSGVVVLQVPGEQFENTVTRIRQLALKVVKQESSAQDVSEEYVDLRSQITNLQRTEDGLQKLVDKAQKLEDVLALQRELTNVRGEIEKRQGRLNFLDKRTAFSNITINLSLPPAIEPPRPPAPAESWQPTKAVSEAWNASLKLLGGVTIVVLQVVVFLWWFLPFLIVGLIWWRVKRTNALKDRVEQKFQ